MKNIVLAGESRNHALQAHNGYIEWLHGLSNRYRASQIKAAVAVNLEKFRLFAKQDRNRRIGEFLKELELAEARNTGYPAILRAVERNGSPKPIIETNTSRDYFTFVLPVHKYFRQSDAETMRELNAAGDPITVPVPTQYRTSTVPVTDPVKKLLAALRDGPCSPSDLRIAVGIKHRQTFRANYLNPAVRAGFICAKDGLSPHDPNICYSLTNLGCAILNENSSGVKEGVNEEAKALGDPINGREKDPINETVNEGVNEGVNQLLKIVVENPGKRANDLASLLGKSVHTVERYVKLLKVAGKIEFRGAPKNGGYYKK